MSESILHNPERKCPTEYESEISFRNSGFCTASVGLKVLFVGMFDGLGSTDDKNTECARQRSLCSRALSAGARDVKKTTSLANNINYWKSARHEI